MRLSVIDFIVTYRNAISGILMILGIIAYIVYAIHYVKTKQKFIDLCTLFVDKFNARPAEVLIYQDSGVFFSFMRDAFYIKALYFKENAFHMRDMDNEQIRFIKNLPREYTDWLRVKVRISIVGAVLLLLMLATYYLPPLLVK